MVPKVLIPDSAITKNRHKVRGMLAPHTSKDSVKAKIIALNRVTNGWCQYYRVTSYPSAVFNKKKIRTLLGHGALARSQVGTKHPTDNEGILRPSTQHL